MTIVMVKNEEFRVARLNCKISKPHIYTHSHVKNNGRKQTPTLLSHHTKSSYIYIYTENTNDIEKKWKSQCVCNFFSSPVWNSCAQEVLTAHGRLRRQRRIHYVRLEVVLMSTPYRCVVLEWGWNGNIVWGDENRKCLSGRMSRLCPRAPFVFDRE